MVRASRTTRCVGTAPGKASSHGKYGKIDYLVNNAFSFIAKGMDATREDWETMFRVGPFSYAKMIQPKKGSCELRILLEVIQTTGHGQQTTLSRCSPIG